MKEGNGKEKKGIKKKKRKNENWREYRKKKWNKGKKEREKANMKERKKERKKEHEIIDIKKNLKEGKKSWKLRERKKVDRGYWRSDKISDIVVGKIKEVKKEGNTKDNNFFFKGQNLSKKVMKDNYFSRSRLFTK